MQGLKLLNRLYATMKHCRSPQQNSTNNTKANMKSPTHLQALNTCCNHNQQSQPKQRATQQSKHLQRQTDTKDACMQARTHTHTLIKPSARKPERQKHKKDKSSEPRCRSIIANGSEGPPRCLDRGSCLRNCFVRLGFRFPETPISLNEGINPKV